jgi:hypothetical protein
VARPRRVRRAARLGCRRSRSGFFGRRRRNRLLGRSGSFGRGATARGRSAAGGCGSTAARSRLAAGGFHRSGCGFGHRGGFGSGAGRGRRTAINRSGLAAAHDFFTAAHRSAAIVVVMMAKPAEQTSLGLARTTGSHGDCHSKELATHCLSSKGCLNRDRIVPTAHGELLAGPTKSGGDITLGRARQPSSKCPTYRT